QAGIPLVPGTDRVTDPETALAFGAEAGYPVLVKAAGGGGGRGIRVVATPGELAGALQQASQEAQQAFGDAGVYLEKYLLPVRHVEIQIMADAHGTVVGLGERECSIQRRHQKIIEEAPSVAVSPELRGRMIAAAVAAARAADYRGAGTVEFLLDRDGRFYFLEVNTRLQVEHPVTELLTGRDLVRDQLRVAAGQPLGYTQDDVSPRGWALECRITAEDPHNSFLPSLGRVRLVQLPSGPGVRVDSSLYDGLEVSPYYDSLLAKVIVWGEDRPQAIARMRRALDEFVLLGVKTNIPFHRYLLDLPDFQAGAINTSFLEEVLEHFAAAATANRDLAAITAAVLAHSGLSPTSAAPDQASSVGAASQSTWATAYRMRNSGYWKV
ncbi:MAG: acetyl-CoA carboxylase biotin carboxylase subunit, partial [Chloroflexota bacterium]